MVSILLSIGWIIQPPITADVSFADWRIFIYRSGSKQTVCLPESPPDLSMTPSSTTISVYSCDDGIFWSDLEKHS